MFAKYPSHVELLNVEKIKRGHWRVVTKSGVNHLEQQFGPEPYKLMRGHELWVFKMDQPDEDGREYECLVGNHRLELCKKM